MNNPDNTVKVTVDIVDGIANVASIIAPPGVTVDVETRDYDVDNSDPDYLRDNATLDESDVPYVSGGDIHEGTGPLLTTLAAILARIAGEFDHPALLQYGPLEADTLADVSRIARHAFDAAAPSLSAYQLSAMLGRLPVARCVMQPEDVLTAFNLGQSETGDSDDQHAERIGKAAEWLAENRKYVEEAMTRDGFAAIEALASADEFGPE